MPTIKFLNEKKSVEVETGANLRRAAIREGVRLSSKVLIKKGVENIKPAGVWERLRLFLGPIAFLTRIGHENELRLAGKVQVNGDIEVENRPPVNFHGEKFWG
jgi:hypothetical protein